MVRRSFTPQERKRLSLERDTVDVGEYPKAFRRKHPIQQARAERAMRREVHRRLAEGREDVDEVRRREVRKWPPARLGELVQAKAARRAVLQENPRKSRQARERRQRRRGQSAVAGGAANRFIALVGAGLGYIKSSRLSR